MSQIAELSEAEIEERFYISGRTAVQFMLGSLAEDKERFSVQFAGREEQFLTILLAVDSENGRLIVDCSGSEEINRHFPASRRNVFLARPCGIHVQFSTAAAREVRFQGARAFSVPLPDHIIRRQRRECFRIETPRARPLRLEAYGPGGRLLTFPVHDLSVAGIGLSDVRANGLEPGVVLSNCRLPLPENEVDVRVRTSVRHVTALPLRTGVTGWRFGLQFVDMSRADEKRIQRYIIYREHEQNELL